MPKSDVGFKRAMYHETVGAISHHPVMRQLDSFIFRSSFGRILAMSVVKMEGALTQAFAYLLTMAIHTYVVFEIEQTDYRSYGYLTHVVVSFVLLMACTIAFSVQRPCLEKKLKHHPEDFYDTKTVTALHQMNTINQV